MCKHELAKAERILGRRAQPTRFHPQWCPRPQQRVFPLLLLFASPSAVSLGCQFDMAVSHPAAEHGEWHAANEVLHCEVVAKVSHRHAFDSGDFEKPFPNARSAAFHGSSIEADIRQAILVWNHQLIGGSVLLLAPELL